MFINNQENLCFMKKQSNLFKLLFLFLALFSFLNINAQEMTVTGVVTDASDGMPLPGVTVAIKGTTTGTITTPDGTYTLKANKGQILVYSFIGYKNVESIVGDQSQINIALDADVIGMEEVVVIGYGVQKKEDKTGSVYSVTDKDIQTVAIQDPIEGIQGKVAGVTIRKGGSDPNSGFDVKIRGASGLSSGTNPLYVVDGVVGVDPTTIAPEDIASFNVLKDASSAAIYGSRGANGVIIITTKQGETGKTKIDVGVYGTYDQVAARSRLDLMSADEYRAYAIEKGVSIRDYEANTDWQDEIYRNAFSNNQNVAFSGGNEYGNYRASISHNNQNGVVKNSGKERTIMRLNASTKAFNDKLKLSMNLANTIEHNDYINYGSSGADGLLFQAFQRNPTLPVKNEDGSFFQLPSPEINNYSNPSALLEDIQNERDAKRLLAGLKADVDLFKDFKLTLNSAYTRDDHESFYFEAYRNTALNGDGSGSRSYGNNSSVLFEAFGTYNKSIQKHTLNVVGGYSYQKFGWTGFSAYGRDPGSDFTMSNDLASMARVNPGDISSYKGESKLISGFGRFAYNYDNRYYLTGTIRHDGSSKFGANKEWGWFPSASIAWNVKNESFMRDVDLLSQLKIRIGYGQTGNQEIDSYKNIALYGVTGYTKDPITGTTYVDYGALQNPNPNLKWEVNEEINVGLDLGFFNSRLTVSADYFSKKTKDLIYVYTVPVPPNLVTTQLANAGAIDIDGFELVLNGHILDLQNFKWRSGLTLTHSKAIVSALGNDEYPAVEKVNEGYLQEPLGYGTYTQIMQEGLERGTFYGPKFAGIDSKTGKFLYYTATTGKYVTYDLLQEEDKQILGTAQPKLELGWSNTIEFAKNWDATFVIRGMFGHKIVNGTAMVFDNPNYFPNRNILNSSKDRNISGNSDWSDYWLEKGDFVRLENVTIGYNIPVDKVNWLSRAKVFVSGNNLLTLTSYTGIDPSSIGIDIFNVYPKSTSVSCGINLTF